MREPVLIFGGSFDPVHCGHIAIAERVLASGDFASVLWVPAAQNPLKAHVPRAAEADRLELLRRTLAEHPLGEVSDIELRRGGTSYTVDTVRAFIQERKLEERPGFLLGEDSFRRLREWSRWRELLQLCTLVVCNRDGGAAEGANEADDVGGAYNAEEAEDAYGEKSNPAPPGAVSKLTAELCAEVPEARIELWELPPVPVASSEIRRRAAAGEDIREMVPEVIIDQVYKIYGACPLSGEANIDSPARLRAIYPPVRAYVENNLSSKRLAHVQRVEETALELAARFGMETEPVRLSAIGHDLARDWSDDQLLAYARRHQLPVDAKALAKPSLLHGPCAADVLHREYGLRDWRVLQAVYHHTCGAPGLCDTALVLYIADYIEPGRKYLYPELLQALQNSHLTGSCILVLEDQQRRNGTLTGITRQFYEWLRGEECKSRRPRL